MAISKRSWIFILCVAALFAGFAAARMLRPEPESEEPALGFATTSVEPVAVAETVGVLRDDEREHTEAILAEAKSGSMIDALQMLAEIGDPQMQLNVAYEILAGLEVRGFEDLFDVVFEIEDTENHPLEDAFDDSQVGYVFLVALERWAEIDAQSLFDYITSPSADDETEGLAWLAVPFLATREIELAEKLLEEFGTGGWFTPTAEMFVLGLAIESPENALRYALENEIEIDEFESLFAFGVDSDPAATVELIQKIEDADSRDDALTEYAKTWAHADPVGAVAGMVELLGYNEETSASCMEAVAVASELDPMAVVEHLMATQSGEFKKRGLQQAVEVWLKNEPEAASLWMKSNMVHNEVFGVLVRGIDSPESIALMKALPDADQAKLIFWSNLVPSGDPIASELLAQFAEEDPTRLFRLATLPYGERESESAAIPNFEKVARILAEVDLDAGTSLGLQLTDETARSAYFDSLFRKAARTTPVEGARLLLSLPDGIRTKVAPAYFSTWAAQDPLAAINAANEKFGTEVAGHAVERWAEYDPEATFTWLAESRNAELMANTNAVGSLVAEDAELAASRALAIPGEFGVLTASKVITEWAHSDPERASAYINDNLGAGPARDILVLALLDQIRDEDREGAVVWAQSISDEQTREAMLDELR